jgi:hypothetical protein
MNRIQKEVLFQEYLSKKNTEIRSTADLCIRSLYAAEPGAADQESFFNSLDQAIYQAPTSTEVELFIKRAAVKNSAFWSYRDALGVTLAEKIISVFRSVLTVEVDLEDEELRIFRLNLQKSYWHQVSTYAIGRHIMRSANGDK